MSANPRWRVTAIREDVVPNRLTVEYTLDDGSTWATHFDPFVDTQEKIEETLDISWLQRSKSENAKTERIAKGMIPKVKKEDIAIGLVNKEHRQP